MWDPWDRPAPPKTEKPISGRCKASCCKTPYGHAMQIKGCDCHGWG
jgi:hypothetical protein